ncbi:MAG: GGDEF/EAL domain-containing response regulator [Thiotrichales bacterium]
MKVSNPGLSEATIMMVDDEPLNMEIVQSFLEEDGYTSFITEHRSIKAMETLKNSQVDVLLLDLMMPEKDGFEILNEIREDPDFERLPVIILTSATDTENKLRVLDLGATDILAKPVDPSELKLRVRNTLSAKAYLDRISNYDELTGLPNRKMFVSQLEWSIRQAKRYEEKLSLLTITIDNFTRLNGAMGHNVGDEAIRYVGKTIHSLTRQSDILSGPENPSHLVCNLYHTDGGTFTLLLERLSKAADAAAVAKRIMAAMSKPLRIIDADIYLTLSIGIASYPAECEDAESLIRLSSSARDLAKQGGGNEIKFSSSQINENYKKRISIEQRLHRALENNELLLHYQPKVSLETGKIAGVEALLRWQDPEKGMVPPFEFIPLAEETGLIKPIGAWVLKEACEQLHRWNQLGIDYLTMNVNVSAKQFEEPGFIDAVQKTLFDNQLSPTHLTLELTESMIMENIDRNVSMMERLRAMGIKISIDDFGTGYSSLSYLSKLPADELKIDRSFVMNLPSRPDQLALVTAILYLSRKFGLTTVAEGVENRAELALLRAKHCTQFQGFYFSKPLPADELYHKFFEPALSAKKSALESEPG